MARKSKKSTAGTGLSWSCPAQLAEWSPDLAARKVIVAAYMYYVMDSPPMTDGDYDKLSNYVADHWDQLDPVRQWQLETPEATRAGGHHIVYTAASIGAARAAYYELHKRYHSSPYPETWLSRSDGLFYVTATG